MADEPREDLQSRAADLVRKVLTAGVGAIFLTEESLRSLLSEIKLPKELIGGVLDSASKSKNEFLGRLSGDIIDKVMAKVDLADLSRELLQKNDVELNVRVRFVPRKKG